MSERYDIVLRPSLSDVPALAALHVRCWQQAYRDIMPAEFLRDLSVEQRMLQWTKTLSDPDVFAPVARANEKWIGFLSAGPSRTQLDEAEVYAIYVDEAWWRHGVGRQLLTMGLADLHRRKFASATVATLRKNARARRFYESMGASIEPGDQLFTIGGIEYTEIVYRFNLGKD